MTATVGKTGISRDFHRSRCPVDGDDLPVPEKFGRRLATQEARTARETSNQPDCEHRG